MGTMDPSSAYRSCEELELMIEINGDHLERLRASNTCNAVVHASELTRQEIRNLESKLVRLFSQLIIAVNKLAANVNVNVDMEQLRASMPSIERFLRVVGLATDTRDLIMAKATNMEHLLRYEAEPHRLLPPNHSGSLLKASSSLRQEELRRLSKALTALKRYTEALMRSSKPEVNFELFWDSWRTVSNNSGHVSTSNSSTHVVNSGEMSSSANSSPPWNQGQNEAFRSNLVADSSLTTSSSSVSSQASFAAGQPSAMAPLPSPGLTLSPPAPPSWSSCRPTPPTTPPAAFFKEPINSNKYNSSNKNTYEYNPTNVVDDVDQGSGTNSEFPLTKSRSHECELGNRLLPSNPDDVGAGISANNGNHSSGKLSSLLRRKRLSTEPSLLPEEDQLAHLTATASMMTTSSTTMTTSSPLPSPSTFGEPMESSNLSGLLPKSPRTPRSMGHAIRHRFKKTLKPARCNLCNEYMLKGGLKCKECKFKCHRDCEPRVPPSCCLPKDLVDYYVKQLSKEGSPMLATTASSHVLRSINHTSSGTNSSNSSNIDFMSNLSYSASSSNVMGHRFGIPDSSSNTSSCNSSTPSSPAVVVTSQATPPHSASVYHNKGTKFTFPDPIVLKHSLQQHERSNCWVKPQPPQQLHLSPQKQSSSTHSAPQPSSSVNNLAHTPLQRVASPNPIIDSVKSYDSDKTLSGASGSSGSAGTAYRLDSQDSTASLVEDGSSSTGTWTGTRQTSISIREWDIPYEELKVGEKIGDGRFSTVYQGNWHGDVAIKIMNLETLDDESALEAFRQDVSTFRKTRHENIILFMGACMHPPKLAIITSLCKGNTLYTHLHLRKDKFSMRDLLSFGQQIAQGMGYLHHRGIVHKDLKTKNIFLENRHAIIADFGLVNVARRLCLTNDPLAKNSPVARQTMPVPPGWLCYLAPELLRALRIPESEEALADLPFTKASDVFAYGTVWWELLSQEWPWKNTPPETLIWLVGKGIKPSMASLEVSREMRDVLFMCWTYLPEDRPDFERVSLAMERVPKKRNALIRSPSYPIQMSRSSESILL